MNTIPAAAALLAVAQQATAAAQAARTAAPRPRKPATPDQHVLLMVAKAMEAQERAAWASLVTYLCANGEDDQNILPRINDYLGSVGGREMLVHGMATVDLKHHAARILGADVQ